MDDFDRLMEVQRMTASLIRQEAEVDNKIKIIEIVTDLSASRNGKVQVEEVLIEADIQGLSEEEVLATIDSLKRDGLVQEPEVGFVQMV